MNDMELRQLRYFVAVADTLNFSRAAESLYLSQSALSKQIQDLEQELGVTLFERDRRSVTLTQAGLVLLPEAKSILMRSEKLVPLLRHETSDVQRQRRLIIGVEPRADDDPLIHRILTDSVYVERKQRPGLRVLFRQLEFSDMKKALLDGDIDLALFLWAGESMGSSVTVRPLCEDEMVLTFRSRHTYEDNVSVVRDVLERRGLILLENEVRGMSQILQILERIGSTPQIRFSGTRLAMCLSMESGDSAAILPSNVVYRHHPDLRILHLRDAGEYARIWLTAAWRSNEENELAQCIISRTQEGIEEMLRKRPVVQPEE